MKIQIEQHQVEEVLATCLNAAMEYLKDKQHLNSLVIHNDNGTAFKTTFDEETGVNITLYTNDDPEVQE